MFSFLNGLDSAGFGYGIEKLGSQTRIGSHIELSHNVIHFGESQYIHSDNRFPE